jgi:hypothetical protein
MVSSFAHRSIKDLSAVCVTKYRSMWQPDNVSNSLLVSFCTSAMSSEAARQLDNIVLDAIYLILMSLT